LLSHGAPFTEGRGLDDDENHKIMIVMTDGQNTYTSYDNFNKSRYGGFGYIGMNHLGTTSSKNSMVVGKMNEKTLAACTNAKADGKILVYTIAFKVSDADTRALLEKCATRTEMAYRSDTNIELIAAFQKIAQEISMLRLAE
jgi:homoserine kinase